MDGAAITCDKDISFGYVLYGFRNIDQVTKTFEADFRIHAWWEQTDLQWLPEFWFTTAVGDLTELDRSGPNIVDPETGKTHYTVRYSGLFKTSFDLRHFPFDSQTLNITLRVPRVHMQGIRSVLAVDVPGKAKEVGNLGLQEYTVTGSSALVVYLEPDQQNKKPELTISVSIRRRTYFWNLNILSPLILISSLVYTCYFLPVTELGERSNLCVTLFLTAVAFKFVVNSRLPELPYPTSFDKYLLCCYIMLYVTAFENIIANMFPATKVIDITMGICLLVYQIVTTLWFVSHGWNMRKRKSLHRID